MTTAEHSQAFAALYEAQYAFVWSVLRKMGVPPRDTEDLLQDVFVVVHRRLEAFEGRAAIKTWLYAIVVRVYWNYARGQRARPPIASESATALQVVDERATPEEFAEQRQASRLLERMLADLDPHKRTAYVLAEIEGLSAPEIARVTGANTRTIYSRLRAAKQLVDAGVRRVAARERNNLSVAQLAKRSTETPPAGLERRAWLALGLRLPLSPVAAGPWFALKAVGAALAIGMSGVGAVALGAALVRPARSPPIAMASLSTTSAAPAQRGSTPVVVPVDAPPPGLSAPAEAGAPAQAPAGEPRSGESERASVTSGPKPAPSPETPGAAEDLGLLNEARRALKVGKYDDALALVNRHRDRFPNSQLEPERRRTQLVALCRLGREAEARELGSGLGVGGDPCEGTSDS